MSSIKSQLLRSNSSLQRPLPNLHQLLVQKDVLFKSIHSLVQQCCRHLIALDSREIDENSNNALDTLDW